MTLTGVGGVGKTRLATEVASQLADELPRDLGFGSGLRPAAVPDAGGANLGVTQQPGKSVSESVAAACGSGCWCLTIASMCSMPLLDLIEAILGQSTTSRVMATSREALGIAQEQARLVRSLGKRESGPRWGKAVHRTHSWYCVRLSMADGEQAAAVSEICQRLTRIPLAIELAASCGIRRPPLRRDASVPAAGRLTTRVIKHCGKRCHGRMTCSMMRKRRCWNGVRVFAGRIRA